MRSRLVRGWIRGGERCAHVCVCEQSHAGHARRSLFIHLKVATSNRHPATPFNTRAAHTPDRLQRPLQLAIPAALRNSRAVHSSPDCNFHPARHFLTALCNHPAPCINASLPDCSTRSSLPFPQRRVTRTLRNPRAAQPTRCAHASPRPRAAGQKPRLAWRTLPRTRILRQDAGAVAAMQGQHCAMCSQGRSGEPRGSAVPRPCDITSSQDRLNLNLVDCLKNTTIRHKRSI